MNIATILEMAADGLPDRIAITSSDRSLSYSDLFAAAQSAAEEIRKHNVRYVALLGVSSIAMPVAIFTAAYAGVPFVPLNYRLAENELDELIDRILPAVLIVDSAFAKRFKPRDGLTIVDRDGFVAGLKISVVGERLEAGFDGQAVAIQLFTSGTTGKPKAAVLRHENMMSYILGTLDFAGADEAEATLVSVPPYHVAGIAAVLSSTYVGRRMVQLDNFDAETWLKLCESERITNAFVVPTVLARIVDHLQADPKPRDLASLRAIAYGGGKMPLSVIEKAMELFPNADFTNAYGLTETSSTICLLDPEDHRSAAASSDPAIRKRLSSVGRPLHTIELIIRDDDGKPVGTNVPGNVFVRGGQVSGEYLHSGSMLDGDGWFSTRDRGYLDDGDYLFLEGRADDVIVRGGENISPGEIEDVLLAHPAVLDAAVVAMPDEQWGEAVAAAVVLKEKATATVGELQEWVRGKLRSNRVPQAIKFCDALPYNETGKVLRRVIKLEFQDTGAAR